ncbi:MAG: MFS transporter, partial [Phycisphaerales bacterium]|nr:MFS transporter [Phycisphaerales bacterium]
MRLPVLSQDRWWRLLVLCGLYVAQGVPFGFVTVTLAAALATAGATTEAIGSIIAMSTLPWAMKWIAGPFVDRFTIASMGRRRPWILLGQLGMVLTLVAMAGLREPTQQLALLGWLAFLHNCFNALQDVAVDALAVDLLRPEERGRANGLMYGSKYGGTALGALGVG